jgi:diguanylate cyclase (GGDEF)-like protein
MKASPFTGRSTAAAVVRAAQRRLGALAVAAGLLLTGAAAFAFAGSRWELLLAVALLGPLLSGALYLGVIHGSREAGRLALTDRLTGLGNDRRFLERLERDLDRADLRSTSLALCLIDVDDFKRINDRFGHPVGNRVLVEIATCLRHGGEAFRVGGDEFALLLPGHSEQSGRVVAEAVLRRIAAADYSHGGRVTASAGIAVYPGEGLGRSELVRAADRALYRAKSDGKRCVRSYRPGLGEPPELAHLDEANERHVVYRAARGLVRALRARGIDVADRPAAVGDLAARVAARMGLAPEQVELIRLAGTLNDIGKLALPEDLLTKAAPLTEGERRTLERHAQIGFQILDSLGADPVATWVLHHHERWDGRGYPERLAGERIPLGARILFAADAYEAMTTDQAWRPRLTREEALAELERCAGTQFDPAVVNAFLAELEEPARPPLAAVSSA